MFTLAISCFTTSNLLWFMDVRFQVPVQDCSLPHQNLVSPPGTSTTECCFCFGPDASFFLELLVIALHSFSLAHWTPSDLGGFQCHIFLPFHTVHGILKQEYWSGLPFPSPVNHVLSELSTMTHPSWVALHSMAHSFIELDKAVVHVINLISFLWLWFSFCQPSEIM